MKVKVIRFYDSLPGLAKKRYFSAIERWLKDEGTKLFLDVDSFEGWTMEDVNSPQQHNGCDCGVFALTAAEMIMLGLPLLHDQTMITDLRLRIAHEILTKLDLPVPHDES